MEKQEEKQNIDIVDGKITTFAPPAVLAAILDRESLNEAMIDTNEQEPDSEKVQDSLDFSLNDSLESAKLQEFGVLDERVATTNEPSHPSELTEQVLDFPKTSTPAQKTNESNGKKLEKAPRPRRPQHIIERNKENVGKRMPAKTSYARMHATKVKSKLDIDEKNRNREDGGKSPSFTSGSDSGLGNQSEHFEDINSDFVFDQSANSYGNGSQIQNDLGYPCHARRDRDLAPDSLLNGELNAYHNQHHGPCYAVSQTSSVFNYNTYKVDYSYQPTSYTRGYQSAMANSRQSHAMAGPFLPVHYNPLSTQSAPPGGYGYHRKPAISNVHHLHKENYYDDLSAALPNTDSDRGNKIPEPSLHRKFSSEPYLVQSSSPSLQKMANAGRDSKASGSYSSLRQPFQYKPYTLKDYRNFAGANVEHLAGGLGPNVDSDEFKEKVEIFITSQPHELTNLFILLSGCLNLMIMEVSLFCSQFMVSF